MLHIFLAAGWKHFLILCRPLWFPLLTYSLISYLSFALFINSLHVSLSTLPISNALTFISLFHFVFTLPRVWLIVCPPFRFYFFCKTLLIIYYVLCSRGNFQSHRLVLRIEFLLHCFSSLSVYTNLYFCSFFHSLIFMVWNLLLACDFSSICWASILLTSSGVDDGWNKVLLKSTI